MKILVTAGPTREAIDPVRFVSNRSSGKMGYAIARAALARGHEVRLISGPVSLDAPKAAKLIPVVSAADMLKAVEGQVRWCEALVMTAAVADWRPKHVSPHKLKKSRAAPVIHTVMTQDILKRIAPAKGGRIFVGFAAETRDLLAEAHRKRREKHLDLIVANNVKRKDSGFDVDTNLVTLVDAEDRVTRLPLMSKDAVGRRIVKWIEAADAAR